MTSLFQPRVGKQIFPFNRAVIVSPAAAPYNKGIKAKEESPMKEIRIHEQIASLRKARGMTQEKLSQLLGVSNQAVSKWEAGQCCPDIQLLPELAEILGVSCDRLLGVVPESKAEEALENLRQCAAELPLEKSFPLLCRGAMDMHAALMLTCFTLDEPGVEQLQAQLDKGEWGSTVLTDGRFGSAMSRGAVLFADRSRLDIDIPRVAALLAPFANAQTLAVAAALGALTVEENVYAGAEEVAARCLLPQESVTRCLTVDLLGYIETQQQNEKQSYRLKDGCAMLLPLLALFDSH